MRKLCPLISLLMVFLSAGPSHALDLTADGIYRATHEACAELSENSLNDGRLYDQLQAGYFPSRAFTEILTYLRSQSFRQAFAEVNLFNRIRPTQYILQSESFQRALQECYPQSKIMRDYFEKAVSKSDRAGKIVAATLWISALRGSSGILAGQRWWAAVSKVLNGFQLGALTATLSSDAVPAQKESVKVFSDVNLQKAQREIEKNTAEMKSSLQSEVQDLNQTLLRCGSCGDREKLLAQKSIFEKALRGL